MDTTLRLEAKLLSARTGIRWQACEKWMRHVGVSSIPELMRLYPGTTHSECMRRAADGIETLAFS